MPKLKIDTNTAIVAGASLAGLYVVSSAAQGIANSLRSGAENVRDASLTTTGAIDKATEEAANYRETVAGYVEATGDVAGKAINLITLPARALWGNLLGSGTIPPLYEPSEEKQAQDATNAIERAQEDSLRMCADGSIIDITIESCADGSTPRRF
jgi:hypothetical protein